MQYADLDMPRVVFQLKDNMNKGLDATVKDYEGLRGKTVGSMGWNWCMQKVSVTTCPRNITF